VVVSWENFQIDYKFKSNWTEEQLQMASVGITWYIYLTRESK